MVGRVSGHILVHDSKDFDTALHIVLYDSASTQETTFLTGVEVELESVLWGVVGCCKDAKGLKYGDHGLCKLAEELMSCCDTYRGVVVSARRAACCRIGLVD